MKIRVLQFTVAQSKGGQTQFILNNWKYIDKERFSFDFVTFSPVLDFEEELTAQGCNVFHISCYYHDNPERFVKEFEKILQRGYDAIHIHTSYWENAIVEEMAGAAKIPVIIIHSHSTGITKALDAEEIQKKTVLHYKMREQMDFSLATDFCACSQEAAEWIFDSRIPRDAVHILHNAIETGRFRYNAAQRNLARKELQIAEEVCLLSVVGRLVYAKNQEQLIRILPALKKQIRVKLLIIGDGLRKEELCALASDLGVKKDVLFLGHRADVPDLLQATDIFCMPSRSEAFGIALVEAQCMGLPCIASDCFSREAILTDLVRCVELSDEKWVKAILDAAESRADRSRYYEEIRQKGFDIREQVGFLEKIYAGER